MKKLKLLKIMIIMFTMFCCFIPNISNAETSNNTSTKTVNMKIKQKKQLMTKNYNNYKWTTSNKKIATVSKKSIVTAKKEGKVKITRKNKKTGKKKTYTIKIKSDKLKSIQIIYKQQKHWVGGKYEITIKKQPTDNKEEIYLKSSDKNILEISDNTMIIKSNGRASITAYTKDMKVKSTVWITAYNTPNLSFKEANLSKLETKSSLQLNLNCKDYPKSNIKYNSNHSKIIKVNSNGKITAVRPGSAIITAKALDRKTNTN